MSTALSRRAKSHRRKTNISTRPTPNNQRNSTASLRKSQFAKDSIASVVPSTPTAAGKPTDVRRDEILAIATRHFAANGYFRTDVQHIADEVGFGKGTLYRDFKSKEGLFLAASDRVMRLLDAAICEAKKNVTDPLDQITRAVIRYLSFFDEHSEFVELLILERAVFRDRKKPTYFEHREKNVGRWQQLYRELMKDGRVRQMPADVITDVISSALYGTMFTNYMAGRRKSLERQARQVLEIVFNGILVRNSK